MYSFLYKFFRNGLLNQIVELERGLRAERKRAEIYYAYIRELEKLLAEKDKTIEQCMHDLVDPQRG